MKNSKPKKKYTTVEVADDALERIIGGTDDYAEVISNRTDTDNVPVAGDEPTMPVGAITEA